MESPVAPSDSSRNSSATAEKGRLLLIDGTNAVYRAFFAIPNLRAPDGSPTGAVYGFVNMLVKLIREEAPTHVAVAFDPRGGSFRKRVFSEYKAGRDAQPEDLSTQIPVLRDLIAEHRIEIVEVPDFEADDVIATLVAQAPEDFEVVIASTDKDLMQLVSERVVLVDGMKDRRYGPAEVEARFGVSPEQMLDLRSLVGDPSDNIPGVKGIGEKGAAKLIAEWGSLEKLLEHVSDVSAKRARTALQEHAADARLSKELSTLRVDVPLPLELEALALREPERDALREQYQRLGFTRLVEALDAQTGAASAPGASTRAAATPTNLEVVVATAPEDLSAALGEAPEAPLCVAAVVGAGSVVDAPLVGLAFATADDRAIYAHLAAGDSGLSVESVVDVLRAALASGRPLVGWGLKTLQALLAERGLDVPAPSFDAELAAFLLDPSGARSVSNLASALLGREVESWEELAGRGAKATAAEDLPVEALGRWAAGQACAVVALIPGLRERLEGDGLLPLFDDVEMPLTRVLARVERAGVRIDEAKLAALSEEYAADLARIEAEIYELAGEKFLVNSPKQLQVILFEKLKLPVIKKTKTGYSTAEDVLEQLASQHPLPASILAWRRLSKLKSTYIDALPPLVSERTGRIHPVFNQIGAATGRMSSTRPNVQNIPIRSEEGIRIREAFVPAEGRVLVSADYSQVELRILAHYSGDASLIDAFEKGDDIHRRTAAEVAGISPAEVSEDQRARAKAVNFGIIYGSSAFGLANQLGIATGDAQQTIDAYFTRYEGVRRFLDDTVTDARERGFVTTLLGRRRYLPDLASRNRVLRQAAERMAVNSVIQGTAADLIKGAMVEVDRAVTEAGLDAWMILQVHDELVFEVPTGKVEDLRALCRACMEGVFELRVPLVVEVGVGATWREAH